MQPHLPVHAGPGPAINQQANSSFSAVKITMKDLPVFEEHKGLVPFLKYYRQWWSLFGTYFHLLSGNTVLQHQLLMSTLHNTGARQFLSTHVEEVIMLCSDPQATILLRTVQTDQSARSAGRTFAALEKLRFGPAHTQAHTSQVLPPDVQNAPGTTLPADLAGAVRAAFPERAHDGETFPLIWAWIIVVEKHCCKPTQEEIAVWENGMQLGVSNIFDKVQKSENPQAYLRRVLETYKAYTMFAKEQFDGSVKKRPVHVYMDGLPGELQQAARRAL